MVKQTDKHEYLIRIPFWLFKELQVEAKKTGFSVNDLIIMRLLNIRSRQKRLSG